MTDTPVDPTPPIDEIGSHIGNGGQFDPLTRVDSFPIGTRVRKTKGSSWQGCVVGYYSTILTPVGICVESEREPGSVQIYPESALEALTIRSADNG